MSLTTKEKAVALLVSVQAELATRVDKKFTGVLKLEIHLSQGGISKAFVDNREEVIFNEITNLKSKIT